MILIVNKHRRHRAESLRARFLRAGVPCAVCSFEAISRFKGAAVTVCFAPDADFISYVAIRAGKTALAAVNISGRRLYHSEAAIFDGNKTNELVSFILDLAKKSRGADPTSAEAGDLRVVPDGAYIGTRFIPLTDSERLILLHLVLNAGSFEDELRVRNYCLESANLREKTSSVKVHICHINQKAVRATGEKLITCRRGHGYAVLTEPPKQKERRDRFGFVPPFR